MSARLLEVAELSMVMNQMGDKEPLPANSSKTIRFVRQEKQTVATSPTQLTEGVPPAATGLTFAQFEATAEQYLKNHAVLKLSLETGKAKWIN